MRPKSISIHAIALFTWIMGVVVYIYAQNNLYSCLLVLLLLLLLSKTYLKISWKGLAYSWAIVSISLMVFYGLFLHDGQQQLIHIPGQIPLLSGVISWNAILYGFFLGGSLALSIFMFSLFSNFLKDQRPRFYFSGIGANISILFSFLSYFVSYFLSHFEHFDRKMKHRGVHPRVFQKAKLFIQDASFHALENAFTFAETLEMRGFSHRPSHVKSSEDSIAVLLTFNALLFLILYRLHHHWWQLSLVILSLMGVGAMLRFIKKKSMLARRYRYSLNWNDWVVMFWSIFFLIVCVLETFRSQSFLAKGNVKEYGYFDPWIHGLFILHSAMAFVFFGMKRISRD